MPLEVHKRHIARAIGVFIGGVGIVSATLQLTGRDNAGVAPGPAASIALALCGLALLLPFTPRPHPRLARTCAAIAAALLLACILSLVLDRELSGARPLLGWLETAPDERRLHACFVQLVAALALLLLPRRHGSRRTFAAVSLASAVSAIGLSNLLAHLLAGISPDVQPLSIPAVGSGVLLLLGGGTLVAATVSYVGRILLAPSGAGMIARRLALGLIVLPAVLSSAMIAAVRYQTIAPQFGAVLLMSALVLSGCVLCFLLARSAAQIDDSRLEAEIARDFLTSRLQEQAARLQDTVAERTRELREVNDTLRTAAAANSRLALVANHSTNGIVICDSAGQIEWVNSAFEHTTGYTLAEVKGLKPGHFLQGPRTDPATVAKLRQAVHAGEPCNVEILNYTKAGEPYWHILDVQPVRDQLGHLVNYISIQTDTTDQHRHQERLELLTHRFQLAARSAALGVWEWNAASKRSVWDDRMLEIYGLAPGTFAGNSDAWLAMVHPDDRAAALDAIKTAASASRGFEVEYRIIRVNDGAVRHIESRGIALCDAEGQLLSITGTERDVTDERQFAHQQAALNKRLQLALRSSNYGVWELDATTHALVWDERLLELFGVAPAQFTGHRSQWFALLHPDDRAAAAQLTADVLAGLAPAYDHEFRIVRADHSIRHVEAHGYLQRDARGQPLRLVGLARDVTAEKKLAEALRVAEERWQLALAGSNDGVWDWNLATGVLFHDPRSATMLGHGHAELPQTGEGWLTLVHPEDVPGFRTAVQQHLLGQAARLQHEYRVLSRDGHWKWFLDRGQIVSRGPDGRPLRVVGTHADITARKTLEQRLQAAEQLASEVAELAQVGGWEFDIAKAQLSWSPLLKKLHDVGAAAQPTLPEALAFFDEEGQRRFAQALHESRTLGTAFELELPITTARGRRAWLRILGRPHLRDGRPMRVHGSMQDITDRRSAEEARHQLELQLFQAQKMETLGTLAGGIAHDFNNLLTGIIGYHELAADSLPDDHPARACLNEARHASLRARELVEQILTFGRQSHTTEHSPVDLSLIVEEARRFLRATISTHIEIETAVAPECGLVLADSTQIHQVLLNLGSNAAHAMRAQGGTFRIVADVLELGADRPATLSGLPSGRYARLAVSDTGHGIDEATLRRIFDPFFTTKNTREGTGLGLAVVHGIIRAHRGAIDVESTVGHGTTFYIYLPSPVTADASTTVTPVAPGWGAGELIFVVDDEDIVGSFTKLALENKGYQATLFSSARQCLEALEGGGMRCSALVTDQTMPRMQGTELASRLREKMPRLPVVIMSGYFSKISSHTLAELDPVELLAKPFTSDELARALERAFALSAAPLSPPTSPAALPPG